MEALLSFVIPAHAAALAVEFREDDFANGPEPRPQNSPIQKPKQNGDREKERAANPMVRVKIMDSQKSGDEAKGDEDPTIGRAMRAGPKRRKRWRQLLHVGAKIGRSGRRGEGHVDARG